ncbi:MAG: lipopolysaccharide biosynthesis protein [Bacteroidales bacterium]
MGIVFRQSVKGTIFVYTGLILGFITTGILFPRIYSTEQIGLLKIIVAYSSLISMVGTLGINGAIIRLFPWFRNDEKKHYGFLSLVLLVGFAGFLLTTSLLLIFKPALLSSALQKSPLVAKYFNYLIILVFFQIFFTILDNYYSALYNSVHGTFLREVFQRVLIIIFIGLFFFDILNFDQFVILYVAALCLPTLYITHTLIKENQFSLSTDFKHIDRQMAFSIASVSLFSILNGFSLLVIQNIDVIMINSMIGLDFAGIYSICFFFGVVISMPSRSLSRIANVLSADAWKNNDLVTIREIYYKSCLTLFIIASLIFLGVWVNINNIFRITGPEYMKGKWVVFFIALGSLIDMATGANSSIFGTSAYYRIQTYFLLLLVVMIIAANIILIPLLGITGAAIGSAGALTLLNLMRFLFLYYKFKLQPYNIKFLYVILIGVISYIISAVIPEMKNLIADILLRSSVVTLLFFIPVYLLKISEDITARTNDVLRFLKIKK